jgi:hypothetical protein
MSKDLPTPEKEKKKDEEEGQPGQEEKVKWFLINKGFVSVQNEWVALDHITAVFLAGYGSARPEDPIHYTAVKDGHRANVCIVTSNKWTYRCRHVLQTQDQAKDALFEIMDHVAEAKKKKPEVVDLGMIMGIPPYGSNKSV